MAYIGNDSLEIEGVIMRIESFGDDSEKIRVVVKSSDRRQSTWPHAMLNIDDDLFVSLERYHSIVTTFKELSAYLHKEVNSQNKDSMTETVILFSRYATDINSVLQEIIKRSYPGIRSKTICRKKLRVDYDWVYVSGLTMLSDDNYVNEYRERIVNYLKEYLGKRYVIGNFRSLAMNLTRFSENDTDSLVKAMNEDKRGRWILHNPRKLLYHNRFRCTDYTFKFNYTIIADNAFNGLKGLRRITIPDSVKYIGYSCFGGCKCLSEIHLSKNLKSIGIYCFRDCIELEIVVIPNMVSEIESLAFFGCESLKKIILPDKLEHIGWNVFEGCHKELEIIINEKYEKRLRKVLCAYEEQIVVVTDKNINKMRDKIAATKIV